MTFSTSENNTDTTLLTHFEKSFNEGLIMMFCYQSNVFFLKISSESPPAKAAAIVTTILASHGEIIMENLRKARKETVPNNIPLK